MAEEQEESIESLMAKARKGATAEGAREYVGKYLWARLWRAVTSISNCPPNLETLLMYRSEISTCMKMSQDMQLDLAHAEIAVKKIEQMLSSPIRIQS